MKSYYGVAFSIAALVVGGFLAYKHFTPNPSQEEVHYHAGVEIYKDGQRARFDSLEYMRIAPCSSDDDSSAPHDPDDIIHLHDGIDNVVHIHGNGATWAGLFDYLKLGDEAASAEAFLNNKPLSQISEQVIQPYDQAVLFINTPDNQPELIAESMNRITQDYIKDIEAKGESCTK